MVYDCFMFLNEFDALQIRLEELSDVVDYHVLVESTLTFSGKPKPLRFWQERARFSAFSHKICHHILAPETLSVLPGPWEREARSRLAMAHAAQGFAFADDLVMFSDVDEIPSAKCVRQAMGFQGVSRFVMAYHYYRLDLRSDLSVPATCAVPRGMLQATGLSPQRLREGASGGLPTQEVTGGWHFSFLSRNHATDVREKLESYSHVEFSDERYWNPEHVAESIQGGRDLLGREHVTFSIVPLDTTFPRCVQREPARFADLLSPANRVDY